MVRGHTGDRGLRTVTTRDAEQVGSTLHGPPRQLGHILPVGRIQHDDLGAKNSGSLRQVELLDLSAA